MHLRNLHDQQLLTETKNLVQTERQVLTKVLHHLREIDRRRLYCDLGCGSLFEYCLKELKYSEGQACRRIQAMRLIKEIPQIEESIASGEISLSNVSQAQSLFRAQAKEQPRDPMPKARKIEILNALKNKSAREGQKELHRQHPMAVEAAAFERERPVAPEATEVRFLMSDQLKSKLDAVRALLGTKAIGMGYADLIEAMAELSSEKLAEKKFGKKRAAARKGECQEKILRNESSLPTTSRVDLAKQSKPHLPTTSRVDVPKRENGANNVRYVSKALQHAVWQRDGGCCRNCQSQHNLNIDHIQPVALGGRSSLENLRLLCFACNQRFAIKAFGVEKIGRKNRTG